MADAEPKILVVDDDPRVTSLLTRVLQVQGFAPLAAGDADKAWRILQDEAPDAAVVDLLLPGDQDGWALIERIRGDRRFGELPVAVLTGMTEPQVMERARWLKCEYVEKPFSPDALVEKLRHMLARARRPETPRFMRQVQLRPVQVVLLLSEYRVEGIVHLPPEHSRFSDAWEAVARSGRVFIPITRARISSRGGEEVLGTAEFIEVRLEDVRAVFLREHEEES